MLLDQNSQESWEMAGIGGFERGRMLATITVLPCFFGYPTVLLSMVGHNSAKVTPSQSLREMKKRKEQSFMDSQEAANLTLTQRKMLCRLGNPKEVKRLHFQVTSGPALEIAQIFRPRCHCQRVSV